MGIIFTNLTEKKNVPAFNFFLSVNEQFQESFLWDRGGGGLWGGDLDWQRDKKVREKQHNFLRRGFGYYH